MVLIPDCMSSDRQTTLPQGPAQKTGYLDIKQHAKVRPRKLKTWRRRFVVLTKMNNLSRNEYVAKLDLYDNETKWQSNSADKITFVLENVTRVQQTESSTHQNAFEVVQAQPVLVMSGSTLQETYSWILTLQQIFIPEQILASKGEYKVTVLEDKDTCGWNFSGEFTLSISPTCISLNDQAGRGVVTWALNTLKRFHVEKSRITGQKSVLVIESGPHSPTGQGCFRFHTDNSHTIMSAITQSVCLAAALKEQTDKLLHPRSNQLAIPWDEGSICTLLDNYTELSSLGWNRLDSQSSSSTIGQKSLSGKHGGTIYPVAHTTRNLPATETLHTNTEGKGQVRSVYYNCNDGCMCDIVTADKDGVLEDIDKSSEIMKNCSGINSTMTEQDFISDNHSLTSETPEVNIRRLRSISTVVAAIKSDLETSRFEPPDNDATTDVDSAIASMISTPNDDLLWMDMQPCWDFDLKENQTGCIHDCLTKQEQLATQDIFEHEYEELDGLTIALQKIYKTRDSDTPPALPARPPSIVCTSCNAHKMFSGMKTRSLFKRTEKYNSNKKNAKTIRHPTGVDKSTTASGHGSNRKPKCNLAKSSSAECLILDSCSCGNDSIKLNEDVACARCYSPDASLNVPNYLLDEFVTNSVSTRNNTRGGDLHASARSKPGVYNLTNRKETLEMSGAGVTKPTLLSKAAKTNLADPLLSFFLDKANFNLNPTLDSGLAPATTSLSYSSEICTPQSISPSVLADHTLVTPTRLSRESRRNSKASQFDNGLDARDYWGVGQIKKQQDVPLSKISLAYDQCIWNQNEKYGISLPSNDAPCTQNGYIAMMANSDSWHKNTTNCMNGMSDTATFLAGDLEKLTFLGTHGHDLYIQPNHTPSVARQGQQFENVY